jgi:hypothetical protein
LFGWLPQTFTTNVEELLLLLCDGGVGGSRLKVDLTHKSILELACLARERQARISSPHAA